MQHDIAFSCILVYHLVDSILFLFGIEHTCFGLMSDCTVVETTVILCFSKAVGHKRQQIATGKKKYREGKRSHIGRAADVCCPGEMNSGALISSVTLPSLLSKIFHVGPRAASFNFPGTWSETPRPHLQKCWAPATEGNGQREVSFRTDFRCDVEVGPQYLKWDTQKLTNGAFTLQKPCFVIWFSVLWCLCVV